MKVLTYVVAAVFIFSLVPAGMCASDYDDDSDSSSGSSVLGSAVMGGLLGGGLGAAIGSGSGHVGKGAMIGAGIGAVGGTLVGAANDDRAKTEKRRKKQVQHEEQKYEDEQYGQSPSQAQAIRIPEGAKAKKKIVRQYDASGNVISEKEVPVN